MHERQLHEHNSFLTLTLDDEYLTSRYWTGLHRPDGSKIYGGTLVTADTQKFIKRLDKRSRKELRDRSGALLQSELKNKKRRLRYYLCGEYGEQFRRPHYHICLFGIDFADKIVLGTTTTKHKLYTSTTLEQLWPYGHSTIGDLTFETAAYTARYVMKKINGQRKKTHYEAIDHDTGEIIQLLPEYNNMSKAPAIAKGWLEKYNRDVYPHDYVVVRGHKQKPPRYYDKQLEKTSPFEYDDVKHLRDSEARKQWADNTQARLDVKKQVTEAKVNQLKRKI